MLGGVSGCAPLCWNQEPLWPSADDVGAGQRISCQSSAVMEPPRRPLPHTATAPASGGGRVRCSSLAGWSRWWARCGQLLSPPVPVSHGRREQVCLLSTRGGGTGGLVLWALQQLVLGDPGGPHMGHLRSCVFWALPKSRGQGAPWALPSSRQSGQSRSHG